MNPNQITGTLQASGKAAGSATQQDAESGLLVVQAYGGNNTSGPIDVATALNAKGGTGRVDFESETFIAQPIAFSCKDHGADAGELAPTLRAMGHSASHANAGGQVAVCVTGDITHTLKAEGFDASEDGTGRGQPIVAFHGAQDPDPSGDVTHPVGRNQGQETCAMVGHHVRRLTPRECERLQGLPDDRALIPWRGKPAAECPDGPRYKAIGNSMPVPVMRWIGRRIDSAIKRLAA